MDTHAAAGTSRLPDLATPQTRRSLDRRSAATPTLSHKTSMISATDTFASATDGEGYYTDAAADVSAYHTDDGRSRFESVSHAINAHGLSSDGEGASLSRTSSNRTAQRGDPQAAPLPNTDTIHQQLGALSPTSPTTAAISGSATSTQRDPSNEEAGKQLEPGHQSSTPATHHRALRHCAILGLLSLSAIWGTLAREGLVALNTYDGESVAPLVWAQSVGCLIMGLAIGANRQAIEGRYPPAYIMITTGLCGSITTFSKWMLDVFRAFGNQRHFDVKDKHGQVGSAVESRASSQLTANGRSNANPLAVQYNELDDSLRSTLNRLASQGRFGSKIDHVTKHVQHIIERTGEKSLIFSSFGRGLDVVAQSLTANGIRHVRITGAGKLGSEAAKCFSSDPSVHVMLLHSEAQSSGLNLLAASHIHILEPLLNTSLELQAIGRVHRIGQTKETNIWCYYVKDTVEERILALSAYKGQSLYLKGRHTSMTDSQRTLEASASASSPASAMSSTGTAAEISKEDAKKWSAFGKSDTTGSRGTMRGDATSNSTELLACYFARYLPRLGRVPVSDSQRPTAISTVRNGTGVDSKTGEQTATNADRDESREQNDELARLRRARLAALDRR